jgi:hypothetical protein
MNDALSDARNVMVLAISSGLPTRLSGTVAAKLAFLSAVPVIKTTCVFIEGPFKVFSLRLCLTGHGTSYERWAALAQSMSFCTVDAPLTPIAPTTSPTTVTGNPPPHDTMRESVGMPAKSDG